MKNPLVSVLTTTYNKEDFIGAAIESVLKNTFADWELIVSDDCSVDETIVIVQKYSEQDPRIKLFKNEKNIGDYPNRNKAASHATGKYIKYLDADDLIYPHCLDVMVLSMEKYPEAALGISQEVSEDLLPYPFVLHSNDIYVRQFLKKGILDLGPTGTIIRRDVFNTLGGFSGTRYVGDTEFWLKIAARYPVVKIQSGLVFWRRHEGQEYQLGSLNNEYVKLDYFVRLNALHDPVCPLNQNEKKDAESWLKYRTFRRIVHLLIKKLQLVKALQLKKNISCSWYEVLLSFLPWAQFRKLHQ